MNTQLTIAEGYQVDNLIFEKVIQKNGFKFIPIKTKNPDGSIGDLVISPQTQLFSFGIQEQKDLTGKLSGYTLPIYLKSQEGYTHEETEYIKTYNNIIEKVKSYLLENKTELKLGDIEASDLRKVGKLYIKNELQGYKQYLKCMTRNKGGDIKILSLFSDKDDKDIDPMKLLNTKCRILPAIKIESVYIGSKISIQIKLYEAKIELIENKQKHIRLLGQQRGEVVEQSTDITETYDFE